MKLHIFLFMICLGLVAMTFASEKDIAITRAMTFNVRLNVASDGINAWPNRKDLVAGMIRFHRADIVGTQEALIGQVHDLADRLPDYAWFGVGRDDGDKAGEFCAVFYRKERFELLDHSTFWLSEHPDTPGKGWDSDYNRIVTWGQFRDKQSGQVFFFFNTHFDHIAETARRESATLLLRKIKILSHDLPVIVAGDFNADPDSKPYEILTGNPAQMSGQKLSDTKALAVYPHHGPTRTFTAFRFSALQETAPPIDHIFITGGTVINHGTLSDTFNGRLPSDHMPVLAEIVF
ncbi:MAG: endonuclease/exonuclease/phosphatase family protein [candidate division KSB1 bacterium]|nr:endonuclease/exonuclease/phosphatase family protein [candidate division KSB1 bacterium]